MTGLNVTRVTVDQTDTADDLFSFEPCVELQAQGQQIVRARCGHLMGEEGLIQWALQIINRPGDQERVIRCPLCRENLVDTNYPITFYAQIVRNPENLVRLNQRAGPLHPPPPRLGREPVEIGIDPRTRFEEIVYALTLLAGCIFIIAVPMFCQNEENPIHRFLA